MTRLNLCQDGKTPYLYLHKNSFKICKQSNCLNKIIQWYELIVDFFEVCIRCIKHWFDQTCLSSIPSVQSCLSNKLVSDII